MKAKTFLKNTYQITDNQADEVVEKVWGKIKKADNIFNLTEFKNLKGVTPGVDNKSLTNLPKSFWDKAYKYKPNSESLIDKFHQAPLKEL
ncbi:hypothetical protein [Bergeyella zoohelcum]|uniref:Uncharacterized protein n=1 Tax=Bergeyella zoohelcum ATCC 43767 TaxID=883096 RepID=K1MLR5_9FLAO|nr:hypothetical protein [Bergeyella zoohelcum]EKB57009.1 hypothetical protein HMPREF9699_01131 [Bergeyella zoohelcum ATCC 43767]SUV48686.1 Uncharacterised protein [Bergeyella zoohelcum]